MITVKDIAGLAAHLDTKDPHALEKADVGLNNVLNYRVASSTEAKAGTSNTLYMTPLRSKELIDSLTAKITKSSLGLSNVVNYGIATQAEAEAGSVNTEYMTPLRVKQAIAKLHGGLSNPHGITKSTVGLGSVSNYSVASTTEATSGSSNSRYMTPLRVKQAIEKYASDNPSSAEGPWILAREGAEIGSFTSPVDLRGKEVCFVSSDTSNIDEVSVVKGYVPNVSGFSGDLQWYIANGYSDIEYKYSTRNVQTNGDFGNRQLWYRDPGENVFPPVGTINPNSSSSGSSGGSTGGSGGGCIVYDVAMPLHDGTIKLAEDIVVGDRLPTRHFKDMPMGENKEWLDWSTEVGTDTTPEVVTVTAVRESTYHEYFIVNRTLKITRQHEILVGKEGVWQWLDVRDIEVGDYLLDAQGNAKVVESIAQVDETISVFDFDVEEIDTYIAGGYLVHNAEQVNK